MIDAEPCTGVFDPADNPVGEVPNFVVGQGAGATPRIGQDALNEPFDAAPAVEIALDPGLSCGVDSGADSSAGGPWFVVELFQDRVELLLPTD